VDTLQASPTPTVEQSSAYSIPAEAHLLEQVIVHTPGAEMELVSPENREDLLFDDILFVGHARQEHLLMCSVFEKIVGRPDTVLQIKDLLLETFEADDAAQHAFVEKLCRSLPEQKPGDCGG
jgi:arginine deiminase (EC 3.5.3.6)